MTTEVPLYLEDWLKNLHACAMQQQVKADLLEERAVLKFGMDPELMQVDRMKDYTNHSVWGNVQRSWVAVLKTEQKMGVEAFTWVVRNQYRGPRVRFEEKTR